MSQCHSNAKRHHHTHSRLKAAATKACIIATVVSLKAVQQDSLYRHRLDTSAKWANSGCQFDTCKEIGLYHNWHKTTYSTRPKALINQSIFFV